VGHIDRVINCDIDHHTGNSGLHTNIGQVDSRKIAAAMIDTKGRTHEEHEEPTNGIASLERRDCSEVTCRWKMHVNTYLVEISHEK
jgi:hypothetical protein